MGTLKAYNTETDEWEPVAGSASGGADDSVFAADADNATIEAPGASGYIELLSPEGVRIGEDSGTTTELKSTATSNRAITLPDASGEVLVTGQDIVMDNSHTIKSLTFESDGSVEVMANTLDDENGGFAALNGGPAANGSGGDGGDVMLYPGSADGGGVKGRTKVYDAASGFAAVVNTDALTADRTLTMPDDNVDLGDMVAAGALADVATSGDYADLDGAPTLAPVATSGAYSDLSGTPAAGYTPGGTDVPVTDGGTGASTAAGARTNLGLATVAATGAYSDLTGTPAAGYTPGGTDVPVADGGTGASDAATARTNLGLGSVDNTADTAKPVSTAQQSALDLKAPLASPAFTGTPTGITKTHVGLGNVDNTSDSAKPVSTATQTALNAKQDAGATLASLEALSLVAGDLLYATGADTLVRLPKGSANQEIRMNSGATAPEWYTPSAGGGQTTYNAIVAPSGGDYTTLTAALAAASAGWRIFIKAGTYTETFTSMSLHNITIEGAGRDVVILNMSYGAAYMGGNHLKIRNIGVINAQYFFMQGDYCVMEHISYIDNTKRGTIGGNGTYQYFDDIVYISTATTPVQNCLQLNGTQSSASNLYVNAPALSATEGTAALVSTGQIVATNIQLVVPTTSTVSSGIALYTSGGLLSNINIDDSVGKKTVAIQMAQGRVDNVYITGCLYGIKTSNTDCAISNAFVYSFNNTAFSINNNDCMLTNSECYQTSGSLTGASLNSANNCMVRGCRLRAATGVYINGGSNVSVIGNNLVNATTPISDGGTQSYISDNINAGTGLVLEKKYVVMKNTSGSTSALYQVLIAKAVAGGDEVTTTTTASDNAVIGICQMANANNGYIPVQTKGQTYCKVDGTTDIAIGDWLTTFTTAGYARKAAAGELAFARALAAFTTDSATGQILVDVVAPFRL